MSYNTALFTFVPYFKELLFLAVMLQYWGAFFLVGETAPVDGEDQTRSSKTEISLTLTNKFEVPDDDDSDMRALFVR